MLAPQLPLPVPEPVLAGSPEPQYPWPWSVCRWVPGDPIGVGDVSSVDPLVRFLEALHRPAPANAPRNAYRGVPLAARDRAMRDGCALLAEHGVAVDPILRAWDELRGAPAFSGAPRWLHGDLHTANVLARGGRISGVIDFGDLTAGDPACDYLIAWMLPARRARRLRESADRYGRGTWQRARAWALAWGVAALARSADNAVIHAIGSHVLAAAVPWRPETSTPGFA